MKNKETPPVAAENDGQPQKSGKIRGSFWTLFAAIIVIIGVVVVITKPWEKAIDPASRAYFDLTAMNSTQVYLQVHDMINVQPEAYVDKTVKAQGALRIAAGTDTKYYLVIRDAQACCAQGIEFRYTGDFPADGAAITIEGVFEAYLESGRTLHRLNASALNAG